MWVLAIIFLTLFDAAPCLDSQKDPIALLEQQQEFANVLLDFHLGNGNLFDKIVGRSENTSRNRFQELSAKIRDNVDLKDILKDEDLANGLAMVSPLYEVKKSCLNDTFVFLHALLIEQSEHHGVAISMLDASSKLPNGILRDSIEYCEYITKFLGLRKCPIEENKLYIPYGNTKSIGNHVQCHKYDDTIATRYCRVGLKRNEGDKLVKPNFGGVISAMNWEFSICIPKACGPDDVERNLKSLFSRIKQVKIEILNCEEPMEYSPTGYPLGVFWGFFTVLVLFGTLIDILGISNDRLLSSLKKLSMYRNLKSTVDSELRPETYEEMSSVGGILSISLLWIMLSNTLKAFMDGNVINQMDTLNIQLKKSSAPALYNVIMNETLPFDSLFLAFGASAGYIILKQLETSTFSLKKYLLDCYLRLTIPIVFTFMIMVLYVPYATEGPGYIPVTDGGFVDQILHLSNYHFLFEDNNNVEMNYTWFISCLMHLFILAPLVTYTIRKYPKIGMGIWIILMILSFVIFVGLIFVFNLPPSILSLSFETQSKFKSFLPINFYQLPVARLQPFLMGLLVSYVAFKHDHVKNIQIAKVLNIGMWLISFISIAFCMASPSLYENDTVYGKSIWKPDETIIYTMFNKIIWSVGVGWILSACHLGIGGVFNTILSWGPFLVIWRILPTAYLIHHAVITIVVRSTYSSYEYTGIVMAQFFNSIVVISLSLSILIHALCVEPFVNIGFKKDEEIKIDETDEVKM